MSDEHELPLPKSRNINLSKVFDNQSVQEITDKIIEINESDEKLIKIYDVFGLNYKPKPIKLYINSPGGYVDPAFSLFNLVEYSKVPVHTISTGYAASCGFMLLILGAKRFAYKNSHILCHQISAGTWGPTKQMEEDIEWMKKLQKEFEKIILRKTKITKKQLKDMVDRKYDWWMDAKEALKLGVIDEIIV